MSPIRNDVERMPTPVAYRIAIRLATTMDERAGVAHVHDNTQCNSNTSLLAYQLSIRVMNIML